MAAMASAAVSAGVACSRTCELVAVASNVTIISCVEASYPARRVLSRRARSHWSVLGRRMRGMSGARWKQFIGAPGARSAAGAKPRGRPQFAASGQADSCGLTGRARPLYSAGFATSACRLMFEGPCGGIGRRARLKIEFRKECWFDSGQGHQGIRVATAATHQSHISLNSELAPRLGFFPYSVLDRSQLLILSLLIAAPFGPLLTTIDPPPFRGPLHVGVPRLGGLFGAGSLLGSSLLVRRCLGRGSRGLRRRNCRL